MKPCGVRTYKPRPPAQNVSNSSVPKNIVPLRLEYLSSPSARDFARPPPAPISINLASRSILNSTFTFLYTSN
uniref:Uncharacterized protein n=1 Tax=Oryza glumipatula TaxID=40148 RepID=A0A0E0AHY2_9ORYZ